MGAVGPAADPDPEATLGSEAAGVVSEPDGITGEESPDA